METQTSKVNIWTQLEGEEGEGEPGEPGDGGAEPGDGWAESLSDSIPAHLEVVEDTVVGGEEEPGAPGTPHEATSGMSS